MAFYSGDYKEFEKFIGPRLRNIVQTKISKGYKKEIGKCEECGTTEKLEAAHISGRERKTLIREACNKYLDGTNLIDVDLNDFESVFVGLHNPLNENFRILCKSCHNDYDKITEQIDLSEDTNIELHDVESNGNSSLDKLEIQLYPYDIDEFKELLLQYKSAYIKIVYNNGITDTKEWKVSRFNENSDVIGNLRSRKDFRQGEWQKLGIVRVDVEINY